MLTRVGRACNYLWTNYDYPGIFPKYLQTYTYRSTLIIYVTFSTTLPFCLELDLLVLSPRTDRYMILLSSLWNYNCLEGKKRNRENIQM
jgi:hypothetical protein